MTMSNVASSRPGSSAKRHSSRGILPSNQSTSLYQQIVEVLRGEVLRGVYPVGTQLPAETSLAERFKVSRHTVREALRQLRLDRLVVSKQGSGTVVAAPGPDQAYVQAIGSINDLIHYAQAVIYKVRTTKLVQITTAIHETTGLPVGEKWLHMEGFRYVDGQSTPVCWAEVYVHSDYAGVARLLGRNPRAIYELIEDLYAVKVDEVDQNLSATEISADLAKSLGVKRASTAIQILRTYRLISGKTAQVARTLYPASTFRFSMRLNRAKS